MPMFEFQQLMAEAVIKRGHSDGVVSWDARVPPRRWYQLSRGSGVPGAGWQFTPLELWKTDNKEAARLELLMIELDGIRFPAEAARRWMLQRHVPPSRASDDDVAKHWEHFFTKTSQVIQHQKMQQFRVLCEGSVQAPPVPSDFPPLTRWENLPMIVWLVPQWADAQGAKKPRQDNQASGGSWDSRHWYWHPAWSSRPSGW